MIKETTVSSVGCGMRLCVVAAVCLGIACACSAQVAAEVAEAITKPSKDVTLSFVQPGRIQSVLVKEGQSVKADALLAKLDDSVEQAQLMQLEAQAKDTVRVKAAKAQLDQKKLDLKKYEQAALSNAATALEVEQARLEVTIGELSLALAEFQRAQDARKFAEAKLQVARMRLPSPISGKIEKTHVEVGESVNALQEVVRVVSVNPLRIDAPVLLAASRTLKVGQTLAVTFSDGSTGKGRIVHIATVADAASGTLRVRLEVPNDVERPAGERVNVRIPHAGKTVATGS